MEPQKVYLFSAKKHKSLLDFYKKIIHSSESVTFDKLSNNLLAEFLELDLLYC
ncbi:MULTISPECIES: hypothetical protein [Acinetobacter]|uniref:hypothetical protein n=1 Tax=Acinetobacter TaxID=469 RepID=UPI0002D69BE5|nr:MULTISPECIES: hypothetical protein [Acinetobacter]MDR0067644.1 hypothetical protein [Acinetobacter sp. 11520]MDU6286302.1 hypothetical protein [Acinetobacter sp.]EXB01295.1 hypothetical protein J507_0243 [Acinetobacter sp. 1295259]MCG9484589.1 hypothetical protein [Acinetobacter pittii]OTM78747.1 hypothetical protein B9X97_04140 [Acinetobacter pittii]